MANGHEIIGDYLRTVTDTFRSGQATEPSYYPHLKDFIEGYFTGQNQRVTVLSQPKRIGDSMPDMAVKDASGNIIGYIEAKDIDETDLQKISRTPQLKRYRSSLPNFILTNYTEMILFRDGKVLKKVNLADAATLLEHRRVPRAENIDEFDKLMEAFVSFKVPAITTAKALASELAKRAKLLRDSIFETYNTGQAELTNLFGLIKESLVPNLSSSKFADIYAQTIAYGLLFAKENSRDSSLSRFNAVGYIPGNIPLLRNLFYLLNYPGQPDDLAWILDDLLLVLNVCDMDQVMRDIRTRVWTEDPIIHFYETFLEAYDPALKEKAGVFYTPMPVVLFIINSVDKLLSEQFSCSQGLLSSEVKVLDPASGTLTFLTAAVRLIHKRLGEQNNAGMFSQIAQQHILKNFYAFEHMFAPYTIGHFKAGLVLEELGYKMSEKERIQSYLTDTLDLTDATQSPLFPDLANEVAYANSVKRSVPILAIFGNPPYSPDAKEVGEFMNKLMEDYSNCLGVEEEARKGALEDDYVRFIRFAQWKIDNVGRGILSFITNNSYLDGIIHRCMRRRLLDSFDKIYILNLHGNAWQRETAPDGTPDENVFDIKQGVSIAIFIKTEQKRQNDQIFYKDLYGTRNSKYHFLESNDYSTIQWDTITPSVPQLAFAPQGEASVVDNFSRFASVLSIFDTYGSCLITRRDGLVTDFDREDLVHRLTDFADLRIQDEEITRRYDVRDGFAWRMRDARIRYARNGVDIDEIVRLQYRPLDFRFICYNDILVSRTIRRVNEGLLHGTLGLCLVRQYAYNRPYSHFLVTNCLADDRIFISNRGHAYMFPLHLYDSETGLRSNIRSEFRKTIQELYGELSNEESFLFYCYAIFHSKKYRTRYIQLLSKEFPRVPLTTDIDTYKSLLKLGEKLVRLHTLQSHSVDSNRGTYPIAGSDIVEKVSFDEEHESVYINKEQYFGEVPLDVWNYYIGGYQVLDKYLKGRVGRTLTRREMEEVQNIVGVIKETMEIEGDIDALYDHVEQTLFTYENQPAQSLLFPDDD